MRATPEVADPPPGMTARALTLWKPSTAAGRFAVQGVASGGAP
jgi:hypothetical protein